MNSQHWYLFTFWVIFCVLHSLLASMVMKEFIKRLTGKAYRYYRICYSVFATITLAMVLWYQFSIDSYPLFDLALLRYIAGICMALPGIVIMGISIRKYFYELSGIQVLQNREQQVTLRQEGIHKYVRHPLYLGTLLFVAGLFMLMPMLSNLIALLVIFIYTLVGIELEEKQLLSEFGEEYKRYSKEVPKLFPKMGVILK